MRPIVMIDMNGGRVVRFIVKLLLMLALGVLGIYIAYGTLAAIGAGLLALALLVLAVRVLLRLFRGGGD